MHNIVWFDKLVSVSHIW